VVQFELEAWFYLPRSAMSKLESIIEMMVRRKVLDWAECEDISVMFLKFTPTGVVGYPDRIILIDNGQVLFVEFKQKGVKPRKLQAHVHDLLRGMGFIVLVVDDVVEGFDGITSAIRFLRG